MTEISARTNEKIKYAAHLGESASLRSERKEFFLEGARLCADAAESGFAVKQAFFTASALEKYQPYAAAILECAQESFLVTAEVAKKLSQTQAAQGVFCICAVPEKSDAQTQLDPNGRYLALENVQDPSNLGAVCRTAEAMGLTGLIVSGGCDPYNPKALRAAMGSSLRLRLLQTADLPSLLIFAEEKGMLTLASTPRAQAEDIRRARLSGGVICAVGNEGSGLTQQTIAACKKTVTIPMAGAAESLNASAAAAILIWELVRGL